MAHKSSNEEYDEKLFRKEIDCLRLEDYINARTPILHEGFCGHTWKSTPDNVLRGKGCPTCKGGVRKSHERYVAEAESLGFRVLEAYKNDSTPILHECSAGHKWEPRPTHILRGTGCPKCMTSGFSLSKPAILYYVRFDRDDEVYYKIGVTNRSIDDRFIREKDKTITVLASKNFDTGEKAKKVEQFMLNRYSQYKANVVGFMKSSGDTELFTTDILGK